MSATFFYVCQTVLILSTAYTPVQVSPLGFAISISSSRNRVGGRSEGDSYKVRMLSREIVAQLTNPVTQGVIKQTCDQTFDHPDNSALLASLRFAVEYNFIDLKSFSFRDHQKRSSQFASYGVPTSTLHMHPVAGKLYRKLLNVTVLIAFL